MPGLNDTRIPVCEANFFIPPDDYDFDSTESVKRSSYCYSPERVAWFFERVYSPYTLLECSIKTNGNKKYCSYKCLRKAKDQSNTKIVYKNISSEYIIFQDINVLISYGFTTNCDVCKCLLTILDETSALLEPSGDFDIIYNSIEFSNEHPKLVHRPM